MEDAGAQPWGVVSVEATANNERESGFKKKTATDVPHLQEGAEEVASILQSAAPEGLSRCYWVECHNGATTYWTQHDAQGRETDTLSYVRTLAPRLDSLEI